MFCKSASENYFLMGTESPGRSPCYCVCVYFPGWKFILVIPSCSSVLPHLLQSLVKICPLSKNSLLIHTVWEDDTLCNTSTARSSNGCCQKIILKSQKVNTYPPFHDRWSVQSVVLRQSISLCICLKTPKGKKYSHSVLSVTNGTFLCVTFCNVDRMRCAKWHKTRGRGQIEGGSSLTRFVVISCSCNVLFPCSVAYQRRENLASPDSSDKMNGVCYFVRKQPCQTINEI